MVTVDSETLFNGAAAAVSTVAVLYFTFGVELGHSPVSEFALVAVFVAGVFAVTQRTDDHQLTVLGYGVVVVAGVGLFLDVANTFGAGDPAMVAGLLGIAALLFVLRSRLGEDNHFVSGETATRALGVIAVLAALVLVVDVVTGGLAYELQPESEIEYDGDRPEVRAGTVVATNPTPLPERVDVPSYAACTAGDWSAYDPPADDERERRPRAHVTVEGGYGDVVSGFGAERYPVVLHLEGANLSGATFPVRTTAACPDDGSGSPYVALFETDDGGPMREPVGVRAGWRGPGASDGAVRSGPLGAVRSRTLNL